MGGTSQTDRMEGSVRSCFREGRGLVGGGGVHYELRPLWLCGDIRGLVI